MTLLLDMHIKVAGFAISDLQNNDDTNALETIAQMLKGTSE